MYIYTRVYTLWKLRGGVALLHTRVYTLWKLRGGVALLRMTWGVPARTLVRLPEVATRWVRSLREKVPGAYPVVTHYLLC